MHVDAKRIQTMYIDMYRRGNVTHMMMVPLLIDPTNRKMPVKLIITMVSST